MPLYEYKCNDCEHTLEAIQRFSEDPYTICPNCGGALRKLISSPAIQFKGSGFYITDYGKSGSGAAKTSAESSSQASGGGDGSGSSSTSASSSTPSGPGSTPSGSTPSGSTTS
jgi:putative FmdB family regulatory protein